MKKYLYAFFIYVAVFLTAFLLIRYFDTVRSRSDLQAITNAVYSTEEGGYVVRLENIRSNSIVACDANLFDVLQDGEVIYTPSIDNHFSKRIIIRLRDCIGQTCILFRGGENQAPVSMRKINLYLMSTSTAEHLDRTVNGWNHLFAGMLVAIFFWSISLFYFKRSEVYLLHIAISSVLNFINLATPLNLLGITTSYAFNTRIRPLLLILCCAQFGYTLIDLFSWYKPRLLSFLRSIWLFPILAGVCGLQLTVGNFIYPVFRLLVAAVVCFILVEAIIKKDRGALCLFLTSAMAEGVIFYVYLLNRSLHTSGYITAFWRTTELAQIALLLFSLLVVNKRFATKFLTAETLSEDLQNMNMHLEELVTERTEELHRQQAQKTAMMQNIFHDLRTPIFILQEQLEEYERNGLPVEEGKKRLSLLSGLVNDLFTLSKLESGKVIFDEDEVAVNEVVNDVIRGFVGAANEKGLALFCECGKAAVIWGDRLRLQQMLQNLVLNALQHTEAGSITVRTISKEDKVKIIVQDTGEGIQSEDLDMVFERYYSSRKSRKGKSGLGLAIAKGIAEAHEGSISVESEPGVGTTFTVELPILN